MNKIENLTLSLKRFFNHKNLSKIAGEVKFIRRQRKIMPFNFIKNIVIESIKDSGASLDYLVQLFDDDNIIITKQSLHKKINPNAVEFIKTIFFSLSDNYTKSKLLKCCLKQFSDIMLFDSSEIKLNKKLDYIFRSTQNSTRCKLQTIYNLLSNTINCTITKANENDQGYCNHIDHVRERNLVMFDLGYFVIASFKKIIAKKAYFISRLLRSTAVFDLNGNKINVAEFLAKNSSDIIDMKILIGQGEKLPCRLVATRLAGRELEKRRVKFTKDKRRGGKKAIRREFTEIDYWSIYVTNIKDNIIPRQIHNLYRLRWQIELLFKVMKSKFSMREIKDSNHHKVLLMIYGKLIALLLGLIIVGTIDNSEISLYKAVDYYKEKIGKIFDNLAKGRRDFIDNLLDKIKKFAKKSSRKNRPSAYEICGLQRVFSSA